MVIAIDTNVAIDILNGSSETREKLYTYSRFAFPFVVSGELLYGAYNSKNKEKIFNIFFLSFLRVKF